jgi:hypothetical protein
LAEDETETGDPYDLARWRYVLHKSWASRFKAISERGNEAEIRNGADSLFEIAFQLQSGWKHNFK